MNGYATGAELSAIRDSTGRFFACFDALTNFTITLLQLTAVPLVVTSSLPPIFPLFVSQIILLHS